jgi:hypothetical protein
MISTIFTFVYVVVGLLAAAAGTAVLFGLLTGKLLDRWAVHFLRSTLAISVIGLLFPFHHLLPTHGISMLAVYITGAAVVAWRKFHFEGVWSSIFALSTTIVLYLDLLVVMGQVFKYIPSLNGIAPTLSEPPFIAIQLAVVLLLVGLGSVAINRFRATQAHTI